MCTDLEGLQLEQRLCVPLLQVRKVVLSLCPKPRSPIGAILILAGLEPLAAAVSALLVRAGGGRGCSLCVWAHIVRGTSVMPTVSGCPLSTSLGSERLMQAHTQVAPLTSTPNTPGALGHPGDRRTVTHSGLHKRVNPGPTGAWQLAPLLDPRPQGTRPNGVVGNGGSLTHSPSCTEDVKHGGHHTLQVIHRARDEQVVGSSAGVQGRSSTTTDPGGSRLDSLVAGSLLVSDPR